MKTIIIILLTAIICLSTSPKTQEVRTLYFENETLYSYKNKIDVYAKYGYSVKSLVAIHCKVHTEGTYTTQDGSASYDKFLLILQK